MGMLYLAGWPRARLVVAVGPMGCRGIWPSAQPITNVSMPASARRPHFPPGASYGSVCRSFSVSAGPAFGVLLVVRVGQG